MSIRPIGREISEELMNVESPAHGTTAAIPIQFLRAKRRPNLMWREVDLKATVQALASGSRPEVRRALATGRQERLHQQQQQQSLADKSFVDDHDSQKARENEDVEPGDRHVYLSPAEVVRKVGSQLSGGYRRTFDVQADVVSSGILDDKTARDLVGEFVSRRRNTLLINSEADLAPKNRDLRHASPFLHDACCLHAMRFSEHSSSVLHRRVFEHVRLQMGQLMIASPLPLEELTGIMIMALWASAPSCKLLLNFEKPTMLDAMVYAEIMLYMILQDKFAQRSYLGSDGTCEELSTWKTRWNYLFATSDQDSLSSSPRLAPADARTDRRHRNADPQSLPDMTQSRVRAFATDVVRAFVDMPGSRAEELPEFHRLCVAYAMLIISKYEPRSSLLEGDGVGTGVVEGDDAVLELLRAAQRHNGVRGNSAPSAIQFGLERALKKVAERTEARAGSTAGTTTGSDGHGLPEVGVSFIRSGSLRGPSAVAAAATATPTWTHHQDNVRGQHNHNPSSFTGATLVPEFDESLSLETMDIFFSGGHLGLGDHSFF
ncbi:hypothetical protein Landi51_05833 [Colletotrichum acutatum]